MHRLLLFVALAVGSALPAAAPPPAENVHWAFCAPVRPKVPRLADAGRAHNPVDFFILAGLERKGLRLAAPADRRTLLRRVTFDLTGLPPTPEEMNAFLHD